MDISVDLAELSFTWAGKEDWPDVERLFGERGACGGCWCMVWRLRPKAWREGKAGRNRVEFEKLVRSGARPGILARLDSRPVGWCAVAPRSEYGSLRRSRILKEVDSEPVWSVSCLFVLKFARRRGVSVALLEAAGRLAAERGATILEGYPVVPTMAKTPDPFIWTGVPSAFLRAGFIEVARRSATRPIMRKTLSSKV